MTIYIQKISYITNYSLHANCSLKWKNYKRAITVVYMYDNVVNIPYNTNYSLHADCTLSRMKFLVCI
jgi:hypothetical protein